MDRSKKLKLSLETLRLLKPAEVVGLEVVGGGETVPCYFMTSLQNPMGGCTDQ